MLRKNKDKDKEKESRQTVLIDQSVIQRDWEDREFVETIQIQIIETVAFLNQFDNIVRTKIGVLNEKLSKLERSVEYCEVAIKCSQDRLKREGKMV